MTTIDPFRFICPACTGRLDSSADRLSLQCSGCKRMYGVHEGIPVLIASEAGSGTESAFDYLAHYSTDAEVFDYFEEQHGATEYSERRLREFVRSVIPEGTTEILDVGCGSAWIAKHYVPLGVQVCSLDASTRNPSTAVSKYPGPNHRGVAADAYHLPFADGSIQCVVATEIIEHVVDPAGFVRELMRVVAPGGVLVLSTPYKETLRYTLCIHCNQRTPLNAHLHSFDEEKLHALCPPNALRDFSWHAFNNKLLLFARTHVILTYLPFPIWKFVDRIANAAYNKPVNIVCSYQKI